MPLQTGRKPYLLPNLTKSSYLTILESDMLKTPTHQRQRGQGLSEYIIIVALIAVAAIGAVGFFGGTISNQVGAMAKEMSGQNADTEIEAAGTAADSSAGAAGSRGLADYNEGNTNNTGGGDGG